MFSILYRSFDRRRDQSTRSSTFLFIAAGICLCITGFLIISAIVLALIPIYIPSKTVTTESNGFQSKENSIVVKLNENDSSSGRRRRDLDSYCTNITGGEIQGTSSESIRQLIIRGLPTTYPKCRDLVISKITIESDQYNKRRKRYFPISRRASSSCALVLLIKYYIYYKIDCFSACQKTRNSQLYTELYSNRGIWKNQQFTDVIIYKNGSPIGTFNINLDEFYWMSDPNTDEIISTASTTTTAVPSSTAALSG